MPIYLVNVRAPTARTNIFLKSVGGMRAPKARAKILNNRFNYPYKCFFNIKINENIKKKYLAFAQKKGLKGFKRFFC